jgi:hypothetical protein
MSLSPHEIAWYLYLGIPAAAVFTLIVVVGSRLKG